MSRENFSDVDFDCRFAPNFEFCFDLLKKPHDWMHLAGRWAYTQLQPCVTTQK